MSYYVGIDLGGTNIAVGLADGSGRLLASDSVPTNAPRPVGDIVRDMADTARKVMAEAGVSPEQVEWVGIGSPGTVDSRSGVVFYAANLGFDNTPVAALVQEQVGRPVYVVNDANAAAYGELIAGAGIGLSSAAVMTLGTGVGCSIVIDGQIYEGFNGKAGEYGHTSLIYGGEQCTCGRYGCLEAYCSVTALIRMTRSAMQVHRKSAMWEISPSLDSVNGRTAFDAMRAGDEPAAEIVARFIDYLACATANLISMLQPQAVIIGGGISREGEQYLFAPLRERAYALSFNHDPANCTQILQAKLGGNAGVVGAALAGLRMKRDVL